MSNTEDRLKIALADAKCRTEEAELSWVMERTAENASKYGGALVGWAMIQCMINPEGEM